MLRISKRRQAWSYSKKSCEVLLPPGDSSGPFLRLHPAVHGVSWNGSSIASLSLLRRQRKRVGPNPPKLGSLAIDFDPQPTSDSLSSLAFASRAVPRDQAAVPPSQSSRLCNGKRSGIVRF